MRICRFKSGFRLGDVDKSSKREREIRKELIERIEEVLRETKSKVRIGEEVSEEFWTGRGVRQRCSLSPLLFNIVIVDLEEDMGSWGGIKLGEEKIYSLAYADDMILMAEEEEEMKAMLARMERYIDKKRLNVAKTKIMIFRKGGGRRKRVKWMWKGKEIEKVKEIKYLGYIFQSNDRQEGEYKRQSKKGNGNYGTSVEHKENKIWKGYKKKNMVV